MRNPKTKWHDGSKTVPGQVGVYERRIHGRSWTTYSYWDGTQWGLNSIGPRQAAQWGRRNWPSPRQNINWRGYRGAQ